MKYEINLSYQKVNVLNVTFVSLSVKFKSRSLCIFKLMLLVMGCFNTASVKLKLYLSLSQTNPV